MFGGLSLVWNKRRQEQATAKAEADPSLRSRMTMFGGMTMLGWLKDDNVWRACALRQSGAFRGLLRCACVDLIYLTTAD